MKGYETVWFIGDEFAAHSFEHYFQSRDHTEYSGYTKENFNTIGFMSSKYVSCNQNLLSWLQNALAKAIQDEILLPKLVIVVIDDDMIKYFDFDGCGITKSMSQLVHTLMTDYDRYVSAQKDYLPKKAKRPGYPHFIWIEVPLHENFANNNDRIKFNKAVRDMSMLHDSTTSLKLKKVWDPSNKNLYMANARRFTNEGLSTYWHAIDSTIKFADTILLKKFDKATTRRQDSSTASRYKWKVGQKTNQHNHNYKEDRNHSQKSATHGDSQIGRKLPTPHKFQRSFDN